MLSSPSGAGKTSISKKLLKKDKSISLSISCTTRPKRKGEIDKKDYIFISDDLFKKKIKLNQFIEYASVFGFQYGTLKDSVEKLFKKKKILGVHFRGTSYKTSPGHPLPATKNQMLHLINQFGFLRFYPVYCCYSK